MERAVEEPAVPSSRSRRPYWLVFAGLALVIAVADQLAKAWVLASFQAGVPVEVIGSWLRIVFVHNSGALFGLFQDQAAIFAVFSVFVIALLVGIHGRSGRNLVLSIALGLLLGGALGNLADRIRLGYVVDFVDMGIGAWRFYTYNVADASITTSFVLLFATVFFPDAVARLTPDD